jgi:hypothetical protein
VRKRRRNPPLWISLSGLSATLLATLATVPYEKKYPAWEFQAGPGLIKLTNIDCQLWVAKSGKTGVGIGIRLTSTGVQEQTLELTDARLIIPGYPVAASKLPERMTIAPGETRRVYVPFPFDNQHLWNEGIRSAILELRFIANGTQETTRTLPVVHLLRAFHGPIPEYEESGRKTYCPDEDPRK